MTPRPRRRGAMRSQQRLLFWAFLVPGLVYLVGIRLAPAAITLFLGFTDWNLVRNPVPRFVGLQNYLNIVEDGPFLAAMGRSVLFSLLATTIELVLGFAIALFMSREMRGRTPLRAVLLMPMVITPAVVGLIWYVLFHNAIGPLNWALSLLGIPAVDWLGDPVLAFLAVLMTDIWHWTPFMFLLSLSALQTVPGELYEAAEVDGASPWQSFRLITLPMVREALIVACILRGIEAFEIFAEPFVMTGGGPGRATETVSLHIYKSAFTFFDMGFAGAQIAVCVILVGALYSVYLRHVRYD
ncbi:carbohydrate ABC transporter permease [Muricoccus radiodurans]|uniref:carbohydrate ABC transporter permease n=1 Tax=Muricoccus radiodurans TaxID=2231721 RepID=UPI003CF4FA4D